MILLNKKDAEQFLEEIKLFKKVRFSDEQWKLFTEWLDDECNHVIESRQEGDKECGICSFCDQDIREGLSSDEDNSRF